MSWLQVFFNIDGGRALLATAVDASSRVQECLQLFLIAATAEVALSLVYQHLIVNALIVAGFENMSNIPVLPQKERGDKSSPSNMVKQQVKIEFSFFEIH